MPFKRYVIVINPWGKKGRPAVGSINARINVGVVSSKAPAKDTLVIEEGKYTLREGGMPEGHYCLYWYSEAKEVPAGPARVPGRRGLHHPQPDHGANPGSPYICRALPVRAGRAVSGADLKDAPGPRSMRDLPRRVRCWRVWTDARTHILPASSTRSSNPRTACSGEAPVPDKRRSGCCGAS